MSGKVTKQRRYRTQCSCRSFRGRLAMGVKRVLLIFLSAACATTNARAQVPEYILGGGQDVQAQPQPQKPGAPPKPPSLFIVNENALRIITCQPRPILVLERHQRMSPTYRTSMCGV